jgi:hypothetical protein
MDRTFLVTPVDYVSQALVFLSQQPDSLGETFHLVNSHSLQADRLFQMIRATGLRLQPVA